MTTRRSLRQQKKQTRLSFQPLPSSSPAKGSYSAAVQDRLANVRYQGSNSPLRRSTRVTSNEPAHLPTPEPSSQPQGTFGKESSPLSDMPPTPENHSRNVENLESQEIESQTDEDEVVAPSSKRRRTLASVSAVTPTRKSARSERYDTPRSSLTQRSQRARQVLLSSPPTSKALSIGSAESSGDEDPRLFTKGTIRKVTRTSERDDPFVVSDNDEAEVAPRSKASSRQKNTLANNFIVDDDEIEYISSDADGADEVVSAKPRKSSKAKQRARLRREQDELKDDLDNLQDSDQSEVIEERRTRGGPVTTQRDRNRQHLELLKRRRAGEPIPRIADSDDEDDRGFDEDDGVDLDQVGNQKRPYTTRYRSEQETRDTDQEEVEYPGDGLDEDEEDDFIVEDDSQAFNSARSGIPLAFTSFASRKPRDLFVHIVEWLIKNKIAPAFSRDDELYTLSWDKINDQIKAQAGSRLISSAWQQDFKYAILARPQLEVHIVNEGGDDFFLNCDACNRTNHPARYEFRFSGHAYHKETLEPIEEDDASESEAEDESADDNASYDQQGHLLPSARRTYNLGRFCAANAEMGHKLTHWKYHLNHSLLTYLEEQGVLSAEAIVAREKLNKRNREKEADNIVDLMQETGKINEMWRDLQNDLEDARFGMEDHNAQGGKRNPNRIGKVRVNRADGRTEEWSEGGQMKLVVPSDSEGE